MLNRTADRAAMLLIRVLRKGGTLMSTYEELDLIVSIALLIVGILSLKNK